MIKNNKTTDNSTLYSSDGERRLGISIWSSMIKNLYLNRDIVYQLARRDIVIRYRKSLLGYLWTIIIPVITISIFAVLVSNRILPVGETLLPYPLFALSNFCVWLLFAGILNNATVSLSNAGPLITKINFPKETVIIAAAGQPIADFIIRTVFISFVFSWYGEIPPWQSVYIVIIIISIIFLAIGLSFLFSVINLAIEDVGHAIGVLLTFAMFLAPILYPPPTSWPFYLINILNPFSPLIIGIQDLLSVGTVSQPKILFVAIILSFLLFIIGWRFFKLTISRIVERA